MDGRCSQARSKSLTGPWRFFLKTFSRPCICIFSAKFPNFKFWRFPQVFWNFFTLAPKIKSQHFLPEIHNVRLWTKVDRCIKVWPTNTRENWYCSLFYSAPQCLFWREILNFGVYSTKFFCRCCGAMWCGLASIDPQWKAIHLPLIFHNKRNLLISTQVIEVAAPKLLQRMIEMNNRLCLRVEK